MILNEWTGNDAPVARTQKARGLLKLREEHAANIYGGYTPQFALVQNEADLDRLIHSWLAACDAETSTMQMFCRPCPVRPRHGFVDSGPVNNPAEMRALWKEAQANDPQAEMLVMAPVAASCSAIYTPTSISFGPGNDGATAGSDSQILFHGPPSNDLYLERMVDGKGIAEGEVPYVEVVYDESGKAHVVQVRSGPAISAEPDYIPHVVYPDNIVQPSGEDLIEWEQMAADWEEGTVIYHPGGNRASHYAIHCVNNNIPYITTFEPVMGRRLEPTEERAPIDTEQFYKGIMSGTSLNIKFEDAVKLMLFGLHTSAMNSTPFSWKIAGMAAMQCLRLGSAACLGEYRHHQRGKRLARRQIFENAFSDFFGHQKRMVTAYRSFNFTRWRSGYGGPKWAECSHQNMFLWMEILEFMKEPTEERAKHTLDAFNRAVNVAHNGGWLFNKFANGTMMDEAAEGRPHFFVNAIPTVFRVAPTETFEPGWARMRRPRVLKVQDVEGVRTLLHVDESHNYTANGIKQPPKPKPTGIKAIQGVMRDNVLHLQFKVHGKPGYITRDIEIAPSQASLLRGLDHSVSSWATDKPYIQFTFNQTLDSDVPLLTDFYGILIIKPDNAAPGITKQSLGI